MQCDEKGVKFDWSLMVTCLRMLILCVHNTAEVWSRVQLPNAFHIVVKFNFICLHTIYALILLMSCTTVFYTLFSLSSQDVEDEDARRKKKFSRMNTNSWIRPVAQSISLSQEAVGDVGGTRKGSKTHAEGSSIKRKWRSWMLREL